MLPTVAYIGGPAEIAYFAQSQVLYRTLLGRMPVAVPRTGYTILDSRAVKLMDRYQARAHRFLPRRDPAQRTPRVAPCAARARRDGSRHHGHRGECHRPPPRRTRGLRPHARPGARPQRAQDQLSRSKRWSARPRAKPCAATAAPRATPITLRPDLSRTPPSGTPLLASSPSWRNTASTCPLTSTIPSNSSAPTTASW